MVSRAVIRIPRDAAFVKSRRERCATARAISGWKVVAIDTPSKPCGSMKNVNARTYAVAFDDPGSVRLRTTVSATMLAATKPNVQNESDKSFLTAGCRGFHTNLQRRPARYAAGMSTTAIEAMPTVAPSPRVSRILVSSRTSSSTYPSPVGVGSDSSVAMMIRFGRIGLQAAAKNRRRLFRNAFATPVSP